MRSLLYISVRTIAAAVAVYTLLILVLGNAYWRDYRGDVRLALSWVKGVQPHGGGEWMTMHEWEKTEGFDLLILGSSHAMRSYNPHLFDSAGYTAFNGGTSAQTPQLSLVLFDHFSKGNRGTLILDVYDVIFEIEGIEAANIVIENADNKDLQRKVALEWFSCASVNAYSSALLSFRDQEEKTPLGYRGKGFEPLLLPMRSVIAEDPRPYKENEKSWRAFHTLIKKALSSGWKVVLVSQPLPNVEAVQEYHNQFLKRLEPIVNEFQLAYLDLTADTEFRSIELYSDLKHLNYLGANKFTQRVIQYLKSDSTVQSNP